MSTTTAPTTRSSAKPLVVAGVVAAAVASVATSAVAAAGDFAGISLAVGGAPIPVLGFATLTAVFSLVGLALALGLNRWAVRPRLVFVRTTVALTALSLVPDVLADATTTTKALLIVTHLVAAAIVIPTIARRLSA